MGLPPIKELAQLLSSENGKRIDRILTRLDNLSKDQSSVTEVTRLLELVCELDRTGALARLDSILSHIPKGKGGQALIIEVRHLVVELGDKIDKISDLASAILKEEG